MPTIPKYPEEKDLSDYLHYIADEFTVDGFVWHEQIGAGLVTNIKKKDGTCVNHTERTSDDVSMIRVNFLFFPGLADVSSDFLTPLSLSSERVDIILSIFKSCVQESVDTHGVHLPVPGINKKMVGFKGADRE